MKELKCTGCGAPLIGGAFSGEYVCQYCGARYEKKEEYNGNVMLLQVEPGYIRTVSAQMAVPYETIMHLGEDLTEKIAKKDLAEKIADLLVEDYFTVTANDDIIHGTKIITGKIRVVAPWYKAGV